MECNTQQARGRHTHQNKLHRQMQREPNATIQTQVTKAAAARRATSAPPRYGQPRLKVSLSKSKNTALDGDAAKELRDLSDPLLMDDDAYILPLDTFESLKYRDYSRLSDHRRPHDGRHREKFTEPIPVPLQRLRSTACRKERITEYS